MTTAKYLSELPGRYWSGATVWVSQSNLAFKGKVIDWPRQKRRRLGPGRALVQAIDKPEIAKWCDSDRIEVLEIGGVGNG